MKKKLFLILGIVSAVFAIACSIGTSIAYKYDTTFNAYFNIETQKVVPDENAKIYYWTEFNSTEEFKKESLKTCEEVEGEGAVLLMNKNNTLPLSKNTKFSLFSISAADPVYVSSGSAKVSENVSLFSALEESFETGCVNSELWKLYKTSNYRRKVTSINDATITDYKINEMPWSKYTTKVVDSFANYGDCALVMLSRYGGEGVDVPYGIDELKDYMTDGDYLKLNKEEVELLDNVNRLKQNGTFKKIVILLNCANTLQLDFLNNYDVDAVLHIGLPGETGINAVADILSGEVVPSGRLTDTYLYDNHSAPAMVNFGTFSYTNKDEYDTGWAKNNDNTSGIAKCNEKYIAYQEGIYVGYRYYETRYEDFVLSSGNAGNFEYNKCVAYPFGFGLSYTDFEYSNFKVNENENSFDISVDVKNTGKIDAKHTVQIYYQSPYTQYDKTYLVEKAAVEICGFDKKEIRAGATTNYKITVNKEDLTSYDANNAKTYILEDGDYYFTVGKNAHDGVNNILEAKKIDNKFSVDSNKMSQSGDAKLTYKWQNTKFDKETYSKSAKSGVAITNQFDNADINKYEGTSDQKITYLSRNDWVGTYPKENVKLKITSKMWSDGLTHLEAERNELVNQYIEKYGNKEAPKNSDKSYSIIDFVDIPYDDPRWDELVSTLDFDTCTNIIYNGFYQTVPVVSINLMGTSQTDGPSGLSKPIKDGFNGTNFPSEGIISSTFNKDLVYRVGQMIGEDIFRSENSTIQTGLYAPGANIHRTPYSGRNPEYFSEDGFISGIFAWEYVRGIQNKGGNAYIKHFALNDQEYGRYGLSVFFNEQSAREIYLKGFETPLKNGCRCVMTSFSRLGVVWTGSHYGLMNNLLKQEWGFTGCSVTDSSNNAKWMDVRLGVLCGQDTWLGATGYKNLEKNKNDNAMINAVRQAAKDVIYSVSQTHAMNTGNAKIVLVTPIWKIGFIGISAIFSVFAITSFALCFVGSRRKKHKN